MPTQKEKKVLVSWKSYKVLDYIGSDQLIVLISLKIWFIYAHINNI